MATIEQLPTFDERFDRLVDRLSGELPEILDQMDRHNQLPGATADQFAEAGLFRVFVPRELGGLEFDPLAVFDVVETLSRLDGSVGWCAMIGAQWGWFSAFLAPGAGEELYGPPDAVGAGALKPGGRAVPVEGGYRVSGRWPFASGCTHATTLHGSCLVTRSDDANGTDPEVRVVAVPVEQAEILDTWHALGLAGTGSHDFVLDDAFVPAERTFTYPELGEASFDGPLYRDRLVNYIFVAQAAQSLGTASGALDAFRELAPTKIRWGSRVPLSQAPAVQAHVAEAEALVDSARAWLRAVAEDLWATTVSGDAPTMEQRRRLRLAITHGIRASVRSGDLLYQAGGSSAVYDGQPLQRRFRDLHAAGAHVQATPRILEIVGEMFLGEGEAPSPGLV
jgi:indole-3-acetate monooxygenase